MATSGTQNFTLDIIDICEEAYERAGVEMRGGYDLKTARRSLDLMSLEWINRGVNLWTIEEGTMALTAGTATYSFPAGTIDFIEHHIRTNSGSSSNQSDSNLSRISPSTFANIPNKLTQGKPLQIYIQRTNSPQFTLWPTPDSTETYTFYFLRIKRIEDVGASGTNNYDAPERWLPALTSGLAYYISMKKPEAFTRITTLKQIYDEHFNYAAGEDRVKAGIQITPGGYTI